MVEYLDYLLTVDKFFYISVHRRQRALHVHKVSYGSAAYGLDSDKHYHKHRGYKYHQCGALNKHRYYHAQYLHH